MGGSSSTLSIVLQLIDDASAAMQGVSAKTKASLEDIQSKANEVRNTFGLLGGAITAGLGVLVKSAADTDTAQMQLNTAVNAGVAAANADANASSVLAKEKANLQEQLSGVNAKLEEYQQKADSAKGSTGLYDASIAALIPKQALIKAQLDEVNNSMSLVGASAATIANSFKAAADANTSLGFSVDDSLASFTTLFRATDSVTESMQANQEAMDLSRAKGIDLTTSSTLLIQAMEGNSRALKQFGINLKDGLSPAEALQELQVKLAGSAKDYVNTPWGQMDVATAKTNMLAAALGNDLMPVLLNFLQTVTPLIQKVTDWADAHPKLVSYILIAVGAVGLLALGVAAVAGAISASISIFLALTTVVQGLGVALAFLAANPIGLVILGIAAVIAIGILLYQHWDLVKEKLSELGAWFVSVWNNIKAVVKDGADYVMGVLQPLLNMINSVISAAASIGNSVSAALAGGVNHSSVVKAFASGGIVTSPTLALVGEAGPEAIIPLSAFAGGSSLASAGAAGTGGITVNINGGAFLDSSSAKKIAQAVGDEIVRVLRLNQRLTV